MKPICMLLTAAAMTVLSAVAQADPPDLSGVWFLSGSVGALKTVDGHAPPLTAEAKAILDAHLAAARKGDYSYDGLTHCLPPGLPRLMLMKEPFEILQRPKALYFVHQLNRLPRRVYLDEALPTDVDPHYLGYSVGKWVGNALVIDSTGFDDSTLLDNAGLPHSEALHLTERYELSQDGKNLHGQFTIDDPKTFTQTWSAQADYVKRPGYELPEDVCGATPEAKRPRS
jgi:hypothetical protein